MKKVLIIIAIICLIIASVIIIKLMGANDDAVNVTTTPSAEVTDDISATPEPSVQVSDESSPSASVSPEGVSISGNVSGGSSEGDYSITVDETSYNYVHENGFDRFYDVSNIDEVVFLEIRYIEGGEASLLQPSFLDSYIDFTDIEYSGENRIGETTIAGETISAKNAAMQMDAWLVNTENGVLAIVISYTLAEKDAQMSGLYGMLNTLEINQS